MRSEPLSVAVMDWAPFGTTSDLKPTGILVELAEALASQLKMEVSISVLPITRLRRAMAVGQFDYTIAFRDASLWDNVAYLGDIACFYEYIVFPVNSSIRKFSELKHRAVGASEESIFVQKVRPLLLEFQIPTIAVRPSNSQSLFKLLKRKRVGAIVINSGVLGAYKSGSLDFKKYGLGERPQLDEPIVLDEVPLAIIASKVGNKNHIWDELATAARSAEFSNRSDKILLAHGATRSLRCDGEPGVQSTALAHGLHSRN